MYNLTDFSPEELSLLCEALEALKNSRRTQLEWIETFDIESIRLKETIKVSIDIERILEMNVRALTAFSILKDRDKTLSN